MIQPVSIYNFLRPTWTIRGWAILFLLSLVCASCVDPDAEAEREAAQLVDDLIAIQAYADSLGLEGNLTSNDVFVSYTIPIDTTDKPLTLDTVQVIYSSQTLSGRELIPANTDTVQLLMGEIILGLRDGIRELTRGSAAVVLVPSGNAYGTIGLPDVGIEPDENLRFDVQLIDFPE
ncbi:FKBP-type peptidyl-prolyl cis-trans isomerase [Pontibacter sp. G13]|uniref:FKBP-type peptidyl-prolyl cis-trans isomerase n=1 Tax=Pontibacter sp. G13 TaxID=3074898 RepID=UPI00288A4195|nr:FKBP-type peptidyl-prolyl cis-trans isomerase [Pontibacter sp. G13]WNJ19007.1 FKBP-type peptidyl-prolyl cis-trans isomerase [Pontibacter sp. G13]